ncbi:FecR family protein [Blastopirellula sp. J2-11]|uniref:FecR family protein n=1 Tax=Blastopirellula sp. J2-11 TaxID=2943192 RepID=UPI0021C8B962|nr:FecR family protein [Blastopirellula sp. J2-11]UUO07757.1 FecR family protein [Blastopirellula sp. J2-11]
MSQHDPSQRLAELTHLAMHASLTVEQHQELEQLLLENAEARRNYFLLLDLEYGLAKLTAEETGQPSIGLPESIRPAGLPGAPQPSQRRTSPRVWLALAACLTGLVLAPLAYWNGNSRQVTKQDPPKPPKVATPGPAERTLPEITLIQTAHSRFFGELGSLSAGDVLQLDHDYALVEGEIQLRTRHGAEMIVQAPAVFLARSADQVLMKVGACSVYAPPGAEGFRVITPQAEIVDKGTRFAVNVTESGEADVNVIEGEAEIFTPNNVAPDLSGLLLGAGEGRVINSQGHISNPPASDMNRDYRGSLSDRIVDYRVTDRKHPQPDTLLDVTVQRGGKIQRYDVEELIGFDLIHFKAGTNGANFSTPLDRPDPREGDGSRTRAALLDRDALLTTGTLNPGGAVKPLKSDPDWTSPDAARHTPGFAVRFHQPVINAVGPDIVFFELHVVVHPENGDPFHVSPTHFEPGLRSHTVRKYDVSLAHRSAHQLSGFLLYRFDPPVRSVEELLSGKHNGGYIHQVPAKVIAVGIDLSDLGYAEGDEVSELFFQDALDDVNLIDPVFLGGLPANTSHTLPE